MKIRDLHATVNGIDKITEFPSGGIEIVADDGRTLFSIRLEGNILLIAAGHVCKHGDVLLDDRFFIRPRAANCVDLIKPEYENV
jgi:hypothetical protein